jgi:hypothetical protein
VLFDRKAHEALAGGSWDARRARFAIDAIVEDTVGSEPLEEAGVYAGTAGEAYGLRVLGAAEPPMSGTVTGSGFAEGELGIALVERDRERAVRAAAAAIQADNELLYGAAGALVAAVLLDLHDVARAAVESLWSTWMFDPKLRACIWTQQIGVGPGQNLGFAHGLAGNAYGLLRAARFQSPQHQTELLDRVVETLERTALRERGLVNWLPRPDSPAHQLRVQWCHGAPGIVCALAGAPARRDLDALLLAAGELTWQAGPLKKGAGLCHGTAGNGYAFLKLYARTRDTKWLERARRFAMHAIKQRRGERGLWEGDLGLALYLRACIDVDDRWPLLDVL